MGHGGERALFAVQSQRSGAEEGEEDRIAGAEGGDVDCGGGGCGAGGAIRPALRKSLVPQLAHPGVSRS